MLALKPHYRLLLFLSIVLAACSSGTDTATNNTATNNTATNNELATDTPVEAEVTVEAEPEAAVTTTSSAPEITEPEPAPQPEPVPEPVPEPEPVEPPAIAGRSCTVSRDGVTNVLSWDDDGGNHVLRRDDQWLATPGPGTSSFVDLDGLATSTYELRTFSGGNREDLQCLAAVANVADENPDLDQAAAPPDEEEAADAVAPPEEAVATAEGFTCNDPCNVVIDGDALTSGLARRLCNQVADLGACHNSGVDGDRSDQMIESAPADVDTQLGDTTNDLLFVWAGLSDLQQQHHSSIESLNVEITAQSITSYISSRRGAGWDYVILVNLPEMSAEIEGVDALNERLNDVGADAVVSLASDPALTLGNANGFRDQDNIHFSRQGSNYLTDTYYIPLVQELRR